MSNHQATLKSPNNQGFSLIEIIVAFSIFSVAFFALIPLFPAGISINKNAENNSVAVYVAQVKIEQVMKSNYDEIATGTIEARHVVSTDPGSSDFNFERQTIVSLLDSDLNATSTDIGLKKISTTVYFPNAISKTIQNFNISTLTSKRQ